MIVMRAWRPFPFFVILAWLAFLFPDPSFGSCSIAITNPADGTVVSSTSIVVQGTAAAEIGGNLTWSNQMTASSGTLAASGAWTISGIPLATGTNVITVSGTEALSASTIAIDKGTNSAYNSGWTNNSNGGSGLNAWALTTTASSSANGGFFMASGGNLNIGTRAWGMYANGGYVSSALRNFTNKLEVGQTCSMRMQNNWIQSGGGVGVALQNGSGSNLWQFWFTGGETYYRMTGQDSTGIGWSSNGFTLAVTLTGTNSYSAKVVQGTTTNTFTGTLGGGSSSRDIVRLRFWNSNAGSGSGYNSYFNDIEIRSAAGTGDTCSASVTVVREAAPVVLRISEFMSSNTDTIRDEDGNSEDWIEIQNAGAESVNLAGYGLSDNAGSPLKWTFPSVTIGAGKHLVVWASSKNRRPNAGTMTNGLRREVWLSLAGETVASLTNSARYPYRPDDRNLVWDGFVAPSGVDGNYGQRMYGYVVAPSTGNYRFWISSDDCSALYLSSNMDPANAVQIASVPGWTDAKQWDKYSEQQSALIPLVAGQAYYICALMKQGSGGDHLAVGWQLPNSTLERPIAGSRLFHTPELHANFGISASGETLQLSAPDGTLLDQAPAMSLLRDVSYGRSSTSTNTWYYYDVNQASPGYANGATGFVEVLAAPAFSAQGGFYTSSVAVSVSSTVDGGVIRYTLDGSEPTASSPVYSSAITMNSRAGQANQYASIQTSTGDATFEENWVAPGEVFKLNVLRARVFKANAMPSVTTTRSYIVTPAGSNRYSMPVISITTAPSNLFSNTTGIYVPGNDVNYNHSGKAWERRGSLEFYEDDGTLAFNADVGMRIHGNLSCRHPRKGLRIYARTPSGDNQFNYQLFPDKSVSVFETFLLRNGGNDWAQSILRDSLVSTLFSNTSVDRQSTRPAVVFIDGEYWGVHDVRDRIDEGYYLHHYGIEEMEYTQLDIHDHGADWKHLPIYDGGNPSPAMTNDFLDILNRAENNEFASSNSFAALNSRIDVDNYIDYNIHEIFAGNMDWPGNNTRVWRTVTPDTSAGANPRRDGRWRWIFFDADISMGFPYSYDPSYNSDPAVQANYNSIAYATATSNFQFATSLNATRLLRKSLENPVFRERFVQRFADLLNTSLSTNRTVGVLNAMQAQYAPEMAEHSARWYYPTSWNSSVGRIRSYLLARTGCVWGHLQTQFGLSAPVPLTINVTNATQGVVAVNSLVIDTNTVGVTGGYPWTGYYFADYPVTLTATPRDGYQFVEWVTATSSVSVAAADEANNYSSWANGSTGGTGFGTWSLQKTSSDGNLNGHFLFSGSPNKWGMYANSSQEADAYRNFNSPLSVGQTFETRIKHGYIDNGSSVGVALQNSSGQALWEFYFVGGQSYYLLNGASSGIGFTSQDIDIAVTLTSASNYTAKITAGGVSYTFAGALLSQTVQTVSRFRAWNYSAGSGDLYNLYVQDLSVSTTTQGTPTTYSTNATITVNLGSAAEYQAVFEESAPIAEMEAVHYWNFNDTNNLLKASYTVGGASWSVSTGTASQVTSSTGQDFAGENARFGDVAGTHLRVNNPIGATMDIRLPTLAFEDILVQYETRRSGQGAGQQIVDYTLNGTDYTNFTTITVLDAAPVLQTLDFSEVTGAANNSNFALRITFAQGAGGTAGNNRFDDFTLDGRPMGIEYPPVASDPIGFQGLTEGSGALAFDLDDVFSDPNGDELAYDVTVDNTNALSVTFSDGHNLSLTPLVRGGAQVTVTATDGVSTSAPMSFRALVYPEAFAVGSNSYTFVEWSTNEPSGSFPAHMIFLQGEANDSSLSTDLVAPYHIPAADAAQVQDASYPYAATSRTRISGKGTNGISFINTGRGRDLGGALLALDTRSLTNVAVSWLGGTVATNVRVYAIRLQYRIGTSGEFADVLDGTNVVEYVRNSTAGHEQSFGPIPLPAEAQNKEYVQVLWRYYLVSGSSGSRAELRLDDILVQGGAAQAPLTLLHYWNFNDTNNLLTATYSVGGADWSITNGATTEVLAGTGQSFAGANARLGDAAEAHLRVNNPIGAEMNLRLPTLAFEDILVQYETRRSGQGAGQQIVDYTLNGTDYVNFATITVLDATPVVQTLDFSEVAGAENNSNFALRVTFLQGEGGTAGNDRLDNFTLEGRTMGIEYPPVVEETIGFQELVEGGDATVFDLDDVFGDPNGDDLSYAAVSGNTNVLAVEITDGHSLSLMPVSRGDALVTVTATDGVSTSAPVSFRVLAYPEPVAIAGSSFSFGEWSTNEPAGSFPQHMVFLQGSENDCSLSTALTYPYNIPAADAAQAQDASFPYAATSRTRINGKGTNGISFINTGRGRDVGGALLALDTRNATNATVAWLGGTVATNVRVYAIRLQYRIGASGAFTDVLDGTNAVEYVRNATAGHSQVLGPVALPAAALNQACVQLLWRYYLVSGTSGSRAELRLDDIEVVGQGGAAKRRSLGLQKEVHVEGRCVPEQGGAVIAQNRSTGVKQDAKVAAFVVGDSVELIAVPSDYYVFASWSGDCVEEGNEKDNPLVLELDGSKNITANFVPLATQNTHTPYWWLAKHGLASDSFEAEALMDRNQNGLPAWEEYVADLDPNDPGSRLPPIKATVQEDGRVLLKIDPTSAACQYSVEVSGDLSGDDWTSISTGVLGTGAAWTHEWTPDAGTVWFFRGKVSRTE